MQILFLHPQTSERSDVPTIKQAPPTNSPAANQCARSLSAPTSVERRLRRPSHVSIQKHRIWPSGVADTEQKVGSETASTDESGSVRLLRGRKHHNNKWEDTGANVVLFSNG